MMTDHEQMMVSALRYALGRRTYIVGSTCSYIADRIDGMTDHCRHIMIRDIKDQEIYGYGDQCDETDWMRLLMRLEEADKE